MNFDINEMRRFGGLTDEHSKLLASMKPMLEKHGPALVEAFYTNLDQYDKLKNLLDAKEGRREILGQQNFCALAFSLVDVASYAFLGGLGNNGAQVLARHNFFRLFDNALNNGIRCAHGNHGGGSHTAFAGATRHAGGHVAGCHIDMRVGQNN